MATSTSTPTAASLQQLGGSLSNLKQKVAALGNSSRSLNATATGAAAPVAVSGANASSSSNSSSSSPGAAAAVAGNSTAVAPAAASANTAVLEPAASNSTAKPVRHLLQHGSGVGAAEAYHEDPEQVALGLVLTQLGMEPTLPLAVMAAATAPVAR